MAAGTYMGGTDMTQRTDTFAKASKRALKRAAQLRAEGNDAAARELERDVAYWQGVADFERHGLPLLPA